MVDWQRMRLPLRLAALALCTLAGGCQKTAWPGPPQAILGGGVLRFLPWGDCARVPIIHGVQGGYHVWGGVRARYVSPQVQLRFTITDGSGQLVQYPNGTPNPIRQSDVLGPLSPAELVPVDGGERGGAMCPDGGVPLESPSGPMAVAGGTDGWGETFGITLYMPFDRADSGEYLPTGDVDGRPIRVRLDLTDSDGRTASDERVVVPFYRQ